MIARCGLSRREVLDELPMAEGWALIAWSIENDPWIAMERSSAGYVAQDAQTNL